MKSFYNKENKGNKEFEERVLEVNRITRVVKGGRRLRFRAAVAVGDKKGQVGFSVSKGTEVQVAVDKAKSKAMKNLIKVPIVNKTIPYEVQEKFVSTKVLLKPASSGTSLIAGLSVRSILYLAGYENIISKIFGSTSRINSAYATFLCLKQFDNKLTKTSFLDKDLDNNKDNDESEGVKKDKKVIENPKIK